MKNMILTAMLLGLAALFTGCDKANAQDAKNGTPEKTKAPEPQAILIIDEVAYIDGCKGCECVEEDICVCKAKSDCECCRKNLQKAPAQMQQKCKEMKKAQTKTVADCGSCKDGKDDKKDSGTTACCSDKKDCGDTACSTDKKDCGDTAKK